MSEGKYFEEWEEGDVYQSPWRAISESHFWRFADITRLNEPLFENKRFVTEEIDADDWLVPGWLTASCAIGLFLRSGWFHETVVAILEVNGLKWTAPVIVGDEIRINVSVAETNPTSSDERGVVTLEWEVENRDEETVMEMTSSHLIKKAGT